MTGYVHNMVKEKQTFPQFALTCARAFGASIEMRDDSLNAEIPKAFVPSNYHVKELAKARRELSRLKRMGGLARVSFGRRKRASLLRDYRSALRRCREENEPLLAMIEEVRAWEPPSPEHVELKKFMEQQLTTSLGSDKYWLDCIAKSEVQDVSDYYLSAITRAQQDVTYHTEELRKERERVDSRNDWLNQLRQSLVKPKAA